MRLYFFTSSDIKSKLNEKRKTEPSPYHDSSAYNGLKDGVNARVCSADKRITIY